MNERSLIVESLQQLIARTIATNASGEGLLLVGGFRYRWLDNSMRMSMDIDYHCSKNPDQKQTDLVQLFERRLIPDVKRNFGYDGSVSRASGPEEPGLFKTVELAFFRMDEPFSRIEIPIDLVSIACLDRPEARTKSGTVYLTASDADMAESKILSLLLRLHIAQRDLLDLYLFKSALPPDSASRVRRKMNDLRIAPGEIDRLLESMGKNRSAHLKALRMILDTLVGEGGRKAIETAGGENSVFDAVLSVLREYRTKSVKKGKQ